MRFVWLPVGKVLASLVGVTVGGAGPQGLGPVCGDHCPALQAIASLAEKKRAIAKIVGIISGISSLYSELFLVLLAIFGYTVSANKKKNFLKLLIPLFVS